MVAIASSGSNTFRGIYFDAALTVCVVSLILIGFVAMTSASIEFSAEKYSSPFFHSFRYLVHLAIAMILALIVFNVPMSFWKKTDWLWLLLGFAVLVAVLIPGIGKSVNGSQRWLNLGFVTLQASEFVKFCVILYMAGYLVRRQEEVRQHFKGFIKPMIVVFVVTVLLMLEPDFGATVVTGGTALGMLFLAGARLWQFVCLIVTVLLALVLLVVSAPYRMQRLTSYADPWADQFNSGYQLTQSLIAFGRGEWFGVGLGNSVQKLFYLPEAHTDFVFAILAEEFGLIGSLTVIALFCALVMQTLRIGRQAEIVGKLFNAYVCYGVALVISGQVFINIGVNTGLLPTKGLTLPFLSYGGSSLIVCCVMLAMVFRVHVENHSSGGRVNDR
jgi:cell division protein FtsW